MFVLMSIVLVPDCSVAGGDELDEGGAVGVAGREVDVEHEAAQTVGSPHGTGDHRSHHVHSVLVLNTSTEPRKRFI